MQRINANKSERNYGIDLFKIFSMYMIVVLHIISHGTNLIHNHSVTNVSNALYIVVYSSVNCFALASGYIMVNLHFKFHRIVMHWIQVVFYSLVIYLFFSIVNQSGINYNSLLRIFTPISSSTYWYFTVYAILFLFMPFYNHIINHLSFRFNLILILLLLLVFSVFSAFSIDIFFSTNAGYSFWWISIMYYLGAFTSRYLKGTISSKYAVIGFLFSNLLTAVGLVIKNVIINSEIVVLNRFAETFSLGYNKLTVALSAWFLLIIFSNIKIHRDKPKTMIRVFSGLTFGVYLIHDNELFRQAFQKRFVWLEALNPVLTVVLILLIALCVFLVCLFADYLRYWFFKLARTERWSMMISGFITKCSKSIIERICQKYDRIKCCKDEDL